MAYDPFVRGDAPVGVRTLQIPSRQQAGKPFSVEVWYPALDAYRGQDLNDSTRDQFNIPAWPKALRQFALRDVEPAMRPAPLLIYCHGGYGDRRESTNLCTHLASHGYVVVSPDFPGDNIADLFPPPGEEAAIRKTPVDESVRNRPSQASYVIEQFLAKSDPALAGIADGSKVGTLGQSMGGYTALALRGISSRIASTFAVAPMWGYRSRIPQVTRLAPLFPTAAWTIPVPSLLLGGEEDVIIPIDDVTDLYERLPAPKQFARVREAGHMHFCDNARDMHETFRTAYLSGQFPDPEADMFAIGRAMRPFDDMLNEAGGQAVTLSLCLAQMDAHIKGRADAVAFLDGNLTSVFAERGVGLDNIRRQSVGRFQTTRSA